MSVSERYELARRDVVVAALAWHTERDARTEALLVEAVDALLAVSGDELVDRLAASLTLANLAKDKPGNVIDLRSRR